ncbi:MAG: hypothetical protein ABEL04_11110 [Salinibacter sp.]|uniref:hypothetical protein n=1 Tax=Salinibacter sp. TaxID=2065818 RepID=UPI0035D3EA93
MAARRPPFWIFLLFVAAFGLAGCEPYLSMTDQVPAQTRKAAALLPESPRYAGMVDLDTAMDQVDDLGIMNLDDRLRQASGPRLQTFLDATGMDPKTDLEAMYGAVGEEGFSAVVVADLTPTQVRRYLDQAPGDAGRSTTYRGVSLFHLTDPEDTDGERPEDTLSLGFVQGGMIAAAMDEGRVKTMIDRYREQPAGLRESEPYMRLIEQVGHGSTAWLVGRNVLQSALRDTADEAAETTSAASSRRPPTAEEAGIQSVLSEWTDRVLGLSESASLGEEASNKIERLKSRVREQAVSITLTDGTLEGEIHLTMRDETSAANVANIAQGAVAAVKISQQESGGLRRDLLNDVTIDQRGSVVHVQFAVESEKVRQTV